MNESSKKLIKESWKTIENRTDDLIIVYEKLFILAPETRGMFSTEMEKQAEKLKKTLAFIVKHIDDDEMLLKSSVELGKEHQQYKISKEHYDLLNEAFVDSIRDLLGKDYNEKIGAAWKDALNKISQIMHNEN